MAAGMISAQSTQPCQDASLGLRVDSM